MESDSELAEYKIADGVKLHVINETKFKTVRVMVRFREKISEKNLGKRVIISNMLETTNAVYTTGKDFSRKLSSLFGATFTTGVSKKGNQHILSINMNVVNPKFVNFDTLGEAISFLKTALFEPDVTGKAFNPTIFKREQTNLIHYLESMNDDRAYYASRKLANLFFEDKEQALPSVGTVELIERETPEAVFDYYQKLLKNNATDIFVLGDVDEKRVVELFSDFGFTDRTAVSDVFYSQLLTEKVSVLTEKKETAQSLLQLGYHLEVNYGDVDYMALQVMNGLLGGFAHSKLFANVREKASLAYSISSTFDSFSGFFKISAGIDAANFDRAKQLIFDQLLALQKGDFTSHEMEQTKTMLRNTYFVSKDSPSNNIELEFVKALIPERFLTTDRFLSLLTEVSKVDIQRVASHLILQAEYFMEGLILQDMKDDE
ncbi:MAG: insulinase family protein [Streptococcaceae bacterium]|nr:insulinase family protein [Streptococcaceae bacterium]